MMNLSHDCLKPSLLRADFKQFEVSPGTESPTGCVAAPAQAMDSGLLDARIKHACLSANCVVQGRSDVSKCRQLILDCDTVGAGDGVCLCASTLL